MDFKKVTLNIDESVYDKFKDYCKQNGLIISKQVERYMKIKLDGEQ